MGGRRLILVPQRPGSIGSEGKRVGKPRSRFRSEPTLRESPFRSGLDIEKGKVLLIWEVVVCVRTPTTQERSTFKVKSSSPVTPFSCQVDEAFDHPNLTAVGGANLFVDLLRRLGVRRHFERLPFQKSSYATFSLADELETLVTIYALGCERVVHVDELEHDPLLCLKLGLN